MSLAHLPLYVFGSRLEHIAAEEKQCWVVDGTDLEVNFFDAGILFGSYGLGSRIVPGVVLRMKLLWQAEPWECVVCVCLSLGVVLLLSKVKREKNGKRELLNTFYVPAAEKFFRYVISRSAHPSQQPREHREPHHPTQQRARIYSASQQIQQAEVEKSSCSPNKTSNLQIRGCIRLQLPAFLICEMVFFLHAGTTAGLRRFTTTLSALFGKPCSLVEPLP